MDKFVIERNVPGAERLTPDELRAIARRSCDVLGRLGPSIQWVQSYVTKDRLYCIYAAADEAIIREHARQGGFPADRIARVHRIIGPGTAE